MSTRKSAAALHAVKDGEVPPAAEKPPTKSSVAEAAKSGSMRELLVAMRDKIAETIEAGCPARELASLTRRLELIAKEIASIDAQSAAEERAGDGKQSDGDPGKPDDGWDEEAL